MHALKVSLGPISTIFLCYLHTWLSLEVLIIYVSLTVYLQKQVHWHCQPAMKNTQTWCIVACYICIAIYHDFIWNIETKSHVSQLKITSSANIYNNVSNIDREKHYRQYHSESDRTICDNACRDLRISVIVFIANVIMCLASHWPTIASIRVSKLILNII